MLFSRVVIFITSVTEYTLGISTVPHVSLASLIIHF